MRIFYSNPIFNVFFLKKIVRILKFNATHQKYNRGPLLGYDLQFRTLCTKLLFNYCLDTSLFLFALYVICLAHKYKWLDLFTIALMDVF